MFVLLLSVFYVDSLSIHNRFFIIDCTLVETPVCHHTHGYITGALIPVSPVSTVHQKNKMEKKAREKKVNKGSWGKVLFPT